MVSLNRPALSDRLRDVARPLNSPADAIAPILDMVGDARIVLIGEASHGTHEFYQYRAEITKQLIEQKGFAGVCAEADWPDAWRVNRFVRNFDDDGSPAEALGAFQRFPRWMWRNTLTLEFVDWLRRHNQSVEGKRHKTGFYGIDLYSIYDSMRAVTEYLDTVDHAAATRARFRYSCFGHFGEDPQMYGYSASFDLGKTCEDQVVAQLQELRSRGGEYTRRDGRQAEDEFFYAEQNARLVANAERYYRTMFEGSVPSWNLRDEHMTDTIDALSKYMDTHCTGGNTKLVVWAHNSHLGDASATEMAERGEHNVGQLVRQRWGTQACNIGFSTYTGTVTAAHDWDGEPETMRVRPGLPGSWEETLHEVATRGGGGGGGGGGGQQARGGDHGGSGGGEGRARGGEAQPRGGSAGGEGRGGGGSGGGVGPNFLLRMKDAAGRMDELRTPRLQRAIGVIYRPQSERLSHYFDARLGEQFDAMIHLDETTALIPLDQRAATDSPRETEETYPTGL